VSPLLAVELARLLLAGASRELVEACLARGAGGVEVESILSLGQRARTAGAGEEQTALALGLLGALRARETPETTPF
jgi:hypothetical protein